ncbi:MAG: alpha/beta hydrolase, partial [Nannocystaceae bacterium]
MSLEMDADPTLPDAFEREAITEPIGSADPLRYRVWSPAEGTRPRATLAVLSGIMSNTAWFRPLAVRWQAMGYHVLGVERRGSGLNSAQGQGDTESADRLLHDAAAVIAHGRAAEVPLVIVGWCWGAILGVHLALRLSDTAGLALLTPGLFP